MVMTIKHIFIGQDITNCRRNFVNRMRIRDLWLIFFTIGTIYSCSSIPKGYPAGDFKFMVISDTHISNDVSKDERLSELIEKINYGEFSGVELLFVTGDVVSSHYSDYDSLDPGKNISRLHKAVNLFNKLTVPHYLIMGNHDYKIDSEHDSDYPFSLSYLRNMENIWEKETGRPPNCSFIHKGWKFICLSSFRGRQRVKHFDDQQLDWLEKELDCNLPVLLFFHHPLKTDHFRIWCSFSTRINPDRDERFYDILNKYKHSIKGIFVGHGHFWVHDKLFDSIQVYETDSFADNTKPQYLIIGINNRKKKIMVAQNPKINK